MTRGIDEVDKILFLFSVEGVLVVHGDSCGFYGDSTFDLIFSLVCSSDFSCGLLRNNACFADEGIWKGALSVVNMSDNRDVSDVLRTIHYSSDFFSSELHHFVVDKELILKTKSNSLINIAHSIPYRFIPYASPNIWYVQMSPEAIGSFYGSMRAYLINLRLITYHAKYVWSNSCQSLVKVYESLLGHEYCEWFDLWFLLLDREHMCPDVNMLEEE